MVTCYFFDFDPNIFTPSAAFTKKRGWWLRYHGQNAYAFLNCACTALLSPSEDPKSAKTPRQKKNWSLLETSHGRGVYTSRQWQKAIQYAVPHLLPGSNLFTRIVMLVLIPGDNSDLGMGVWEHFKTSEWYDDGGVQKALPKGWHLRPDSQERPVAMNLETVKKYTEMQERFQRQSARTSGPGEAPWSNRDKDDNEEQSGHVHLVGFLVTHGDTQHVKKTRTDKTRQLGFVGWDESLLAPQGRTIRSWESCEPGQSMLPASSAVASSSSSRPPAAVEEPSNDGGPPGLPNIWIPDVISPSPPGLPMMWIPDAISPSPDWDPPDESEAR